MASRTIAAKFRQFEVVAACILSYGIVIRGQTVVPPSADEIQSQVDRFSGTGFTQCEGSYYSGPFPLPVLACSDVFRDGRPHLPKTCQMLIEMRVTNAKPSFRAKLGAQPTTAEGMNGLRWQGAITFNFSVSRTRLRADDEWLQWGEWRDQQPPVIVAALLKKNGQWYASDLRNTGQMLSNSTQPTPGSVVDILRGQMAAGGEIVQQQLGASVTLDRLLTTMKQPSCAEIPPPPPSAPGHSLSDTYSHTLEIIRDNESRGIADSVPMFLKAGRAGSGRGSNPAVFGPLPVCSSINNMRRCDPTGETVVVPGDLRVPPGFWDDASPVNYFKLCDRANGIGLEVVLTEHVNDGKKRYMTCPDLTWLKTRRTQLLQLGVKIAAPANEVQPVAPQSAAPPRLTVGQYLARAKDDLAKGAPGHSITDTYAQTVQKKQENESNGIPDGLHPEEFQTYGVCSAVRDKVTFSPGNGMSRCQPSGEVIRVPGDLAVPLDWQKIGSIDYCKGRLGTGEPIVLKNSSPNDGKQRFLMCTDARALTFFRKQLIQLGVHE